MKKLLILVAFFVLLGGMSAVAADVPLLNKDELKAKLGSVVVLDVRSGRDWSSSEFKIQGAIRAPGAEIKKWSADYAKDTALVLYCA